MYKKLIRITNDPFGRDEETWWCETNDGETVYAWKQNLSPETRYRLLLDFTDVIVELEPGVWLAPWVGDPGRTLQIQSAIKYPSLGSAEIALKSARKYRPFKNAVICLGTNSH